jgi:hypothetical protein
MISTGNFKPFEDSFTGKVIFHKIYYTIGLRDSRSNETRADAWKEDFVKIIVLIINLQRTVNCHAGACL